MKPRTKLEKIMSEKKYILEVCVDSTQSAVNAAKGGADRLELCASLIIGGTSPTMQLYESVRKHADIAINVLLRPRFGDFCYSDYEFEVLKAETEAFCKAGADGIVCGCLTPEGRLDIEQMSELVGIAHAAGKSFTCHRAFDMTRNLFEALEDCKRLGVDTVLTSGGKDSCTLGFDVISELHKSAAGEVDIMAGSGMNVNVMRDFMDKTGVTSFHMSGKKKQNSPMKYRNESITMGFAGASEYELEVTDEALVREAHDLLA